MDAAFVGDVPCLRTLVEYGADVNVVAGTGAKHTPLTRLCQFHRTIPKQPSHTDALRCLLELGANPHIAAGPLSLRPIAYAGMGPLTELVDLLVQATRPLDALDAAMLCDLHRLRQLAKRDALVVTDEEQRTPLHYLAMSGYYKELSADKAIECAAFLLEHGVDLDSVQPIPEGFGVFNATALWYAVSWQSNARLAAYLLGRGADPNPGVFAALWDGNIEICELLDSYGADWNQRAGDETPIMEMFKYNRTKLVTWLLDRGVELNVTNAEGLTVLDYARKRKIKKEILDLLVERGAKAGGS